MAAVDIRALKELSATQLRTLKKRYVQIALLYYAKHPDDFYPEQQTDFAFHNRLAKEKAQDFENLASQLGMKNRSNHAVIDLLRDYAAKIGAKLVVTQTSLRLSEK